MKQGKRLLSAVLAAVLLCGSLTYGAFAAESNFSDVDSGAWYAEPVEWCREQGIMSGTSPETFSPNSTMTRAMLAVVLYRAAGSPAVDGVPAYTDAQAGSWYADALVWAEENGLMSGYGNGRFGVHDPVSREQLAAVLWHRAGSPVVSSYEPFSDEQEISGYALPAVHWARNEGILGGVGGNRFAPRDSATRAQVAAVLFRALQADSESGPVEPEPTPVSDLETTTYDLNGVEFKMILVEGGTFTMGSDTLAQGGGTQVSNQAGEHTVTLSSYLIGETEVTRALWNEVMRGTHSDRDLQYPIASVTVPECREFVERLNEQAHAAGIIPDDRNFHLLTEAQWEFAAKGGNESRGYLYAGSNDLSEVGWTSDDGSSVHAVKLKQPNELGIYDMSGNVYEWVADYAAPYSTQPQTDPCNTTPSNNYIKRGGSFYYNDAYRFTCTYRYFYSATDHTIGVRIGLS